MQCKQFAKFCNYASKAFNIKKAGVKIITTIFLDVLKSETKCGIFNIIS
jgi:hypothetical protein